MRMHQQVHVRVPIMIMTGPRRRQFQCWRARRQRTIANLQVRVWLVIITDSARRFEMRQIWQA